MANKTDPALVRRAVEEVDRGRLIDLVVQFVNVPSPTGFEGDMARCLHEVLRGAGLRATLQPIGDNRYNAVGFL